MICIFKLLAVLRFDLFLNMVYVLRSVMMINILCTLNPASSIPLEDQFKNIKKLIPKLVSEHPVKKLATIYPKWILTITLCQLPLKAVGGDPLGIINVRKVKHMLTTNEIQLINNI